MRNKCELLSDLQKAFQDRRAAVGQEAFGMELHAEKGKTFVADTHYFPGSVRGSAPGVDDKFITERVGLDHKAVISRGRERIGQVAEQVLIIVMDLVGLAVHQPAATDDLGAECLTDGLVPQAHAQEWNLAGKTLDAGERNSSVIGRARAGRDDQMRRPLALDLLQANLVVAVNLKVQRRIDLSEALHQVVSEGIVIIDE